MGFDKESISFATKESKRFGDTEKLKSLYEKSVRHTLGLSVLKEMHDLWTSCNPKWCSNINPIKRASCKLLSVSCVLFWVLIVDLFNGLIQRLTVSLNLQCFFSLFIWSNFRLFIDLLLLSFICWNFLLSQSWFNINHFSAALFKVCQFPSQTWYEFNNIDEEMAWCSDRAHNVTFSLLRLLLY